MKTLKTIRIISAIVILAGGLFGFVQLELISKEIAVLLFILILVMSVVLNILLSENFKEFGIKIDAEIGNKIRPLEVSIKENTKKTNRMDKWLVGLSSAIRTRGDIAKISPYEKLFIEDSPLNLSEEGIEVLTKIGFKDEIDKNLPLLFKLIDDLNPKSPFDVEQFSIEMIRYALIGESKGDFKQTEDFLYNNPEYNNPDIFKAAGLYLRNKYLEAHPELTGKEKMN